VGAEPQGSRVAAPLVTRRDVIIAAAVTSAFVHAWLVVEHRSETLLAGSFALAVVALIAVAHALTRPALRWAPPAAAALFASLLVAYPVVTLAGGDEFDVLGIATKAVEATGLVASLTLGGESRSFGSADAVLAVLVGLLLVSFAGHSH
jgi:drug/metabolite transporter (DMT)-like permease